ncbi:unnamed protein product, partial [marine sediment metagenome]
TKHTDSREKLKFIPYLSSRQGLFFSHLLVTQACE